MKQFDEVLYSVSEVSNRLRPDRLIVYASMVLAQLCTGKMVRVFVVFPFFSFYMGVLDLAGMVELMSSCGVFLNIQEFANFNTLAF